MVKAEWPKRCINEDRPWSVVWKILEEGLGKEGWASLSC